jgi:hypothetical protein
MNHCNTCHWWFESLGEKDGLRVCVLPAVEPPKPVIERLWILEYRNMDAEPQLQWFDQGMTPSLGTWHRTEITREKA